MYAYKIETEILADHRLNIELPADCPEGTAEIIVLAKTSTKPPPVTGETINDLVDWLRTLPSSERSAEDIEAQIQEERNAWED